MRKSCLAMLCAGCILLAASGFAQTPTEDVVSPEEKAGRAPETAADSMHPGALEDFSSETGGTAGTSSSQAEPSPVRQSASPEGMPEERISLDVKGMDVIDVLQLLAKRAGLNLVISKDVTGRVTLFLKDVRIEDAFDIILLSNDLAAEKADKIIRVMTQREYEFSHGRRYQDRKKAEVVKLQYARAADVAGSLNQIKSVSGRIVVDAMSNTLILMDSSEKLEEFRDFINKTDTVLETKVFSLNYAQAEKLSTKIQPFLTKDVGTVNIDERTNKMAVTDFSERLKTVEKMIAAFDEKSLQVVIDAQIVEITPQKDQFTMGVDWDYWLNKNMRFAGVLAAPSLTDITSISNKLSFGVAAAEKDVSSPQHHKAIIDLLRVIGTTKILSSPRLMVLNNQEAKILVGTKEAYITSSVSQAGTNSVTAQTVNFVDVGIKLYVTPTVNRDGFVTMKIRPEISSSKRTDITSEGKVTQIPIVTTSETETSVMVKDGATIVIAGMKKDRRDKEVKKLPFLGDIPLLGFFFRNTKDEMIKTELVIFITPRIISGEGPVEYVSLTNDEDIVSISRGGAPVSGPTKAKKERKAK